jgi:hypothetical protein
VNLFGFAFVLLFFGLIVVFLFLGRRRTRRNLRDIPAFARLVRGVGLAVEAGQRLHLSLGHGGVSGPQGATALVGLSMLKRIARAASISDKPPVATSGEAVQAILSQDTLSSAYHEIGADDQYDPNSGQLCGVTPFSYAAGALPVIYDQQVSVNVLVGSFGSEVALLTDAAERKGSTTLGGSENLPAQAVLYATTQEPLIGEELYASGAYLQAGPVHLASLRAQDILRWILIGAILLLSAAKLVGVW